MLIYPFAVLILGLLAGIVAGRLLRRRDIGLFISTLTSVSSFLVFMTFGSFTRPAFLVYARLFRFEINMPNVVSSLVIVGVSVLYLGLLLWNRGDWEEKGSLTTVLFALCAAVGAALSSGLLSFILFFEASFLCLIFFLAPARPATSFSVFDYLVAICPTGCFLLGVVLSLPGCGAGCDIVFLRLNWASRMAFAAAFLMRLFFYPLTFAMGRFREWTKTGPSAWGLLVVSVVLFSGLMKFAHADVALMFFVAVVLLACMPPLVLLGIRQQGFDEMIAVAYLFQTVFVAAAICIGGFWGMTTKALCFLVVNQAIAGFGMFFPDVPGRPFRPGAFGGIVSVFFAFVLTGLAPTAGFSGRWIYLKSAFQAGDAFSWLALYSVFLGVVYVRALMRWLPPLWSQWKKEGFSGGDSFSYVYVAALIAILLLPLLFSGFPA